jgi:hypothetical protein
LKSVNCSKPFQVLVLTYSRHSLSTATVIGVVSQGGLLEGLGYLAMGRRFREAEE